MNFISNFILVSFAHSSDHHRVQDGNGQYLTDSNNNGNLDTNGNKGYPKSEDREFRLSSTDSYDWASNLLSSNSEDADDIDLDKIILIGS